MLLGSPARAHLLDENPAPQPRRTGALRLRPGQSHAGATGIDLHPASPCCHSSPVYRYLSDVGLLLTSSLRTGIRQERDPGAVDDNLARMLEIHRDAISDHGLHLPEPPVRPFRMADEAARFEELVQYRPPLPHRRNRPMNIPAIDLSALVS